MRYRSIFLLLCFILLPVPSNGEVALHGYIKFLDYVGIKGNEAPFQDMVGTRLNLHFSGSPSYSVSYYAEGDIDTVFLRNQEGMVEENLSFKFVEAYFEYVSSHFVFKAGKQYIRWGVTDWFSPTDNIIPWDYRRMTSELEDRRTAVNALKMEFWSGETGIEVDFIPVFHPTKLGLGFKQKDIHGKTLGNSEVGLRFRSKAGGFDFNLNFLYGMEKTPVILPVVEYSGPGDFPSISQRAVFNRMQVLGGNVVRTFGRWGIKAEGAYFLTPDKEGTNPQIRNRRIKYGAALDYLVSSSLTLSLQWFQTFLFDYEKEKELQLIFSGLHFPTHSEYIKNILNQNMEKKRTEYLGFNLKGGLTNHLSLQTISLFNPSDQDLFTLSFISYEPLDSFQITGGILLFSGEKGTRFGNLEDNTRIFLEIKHFF